MPKTIALIPTVTSHHFGPFKSTINLTCQTWIIQNNRLLIKVGANKINHIITDTEYQKNFAAECINVGVHEAPRYKVSKPIHNAKSGNKYL